MKVAAIALDLRPRSMHEASDLGVRLVAVNAGSIARSVGPVFAVLVLLAASTVEIAPWLPALLLFWAKPWLDRSVLFVLARAAFGQPSRFGDLWAARSEVWWSQLLPTLTARRLSPWRSYVAPVQQLEGQTRAGRQRRVALMLRGRRGAAFALQWAFSWVELSFLAGLAAIVFWFAPQGSGTDWLQAVLFGDDVASLLANLAVYAAAIGAIEPFFVGAGFAMYLSRRVELEAWDIEQEFRHAFGR